MGARGQHKVQGPKPEARNPRPKAPQPLPPSGGALGTGPGSAPAQAPRGAAPIAIRAGSGVRGSGPGWFRCARHLIRSINDPEHPLTLEELNVVEQVRVKVSDAESTVSVEFTPTIPHCSMATLIGLSIKVKLLRSLPERFKLDVHITPGTHVSEHAVNKQLADKERVAAALENSHLLEVVNQCLSARS
ncbi:mitotic spindle-associated MMXD complex subunit MIP18 [Cyanistes caeruleus]|uniref:mitotic spindle-associated MMXD complex subunit MIP18 n=1 Tax=Cyanistes caeruleus TaxID=156563 RepID=UPI000CDA775C|nr:mitotic spindle-associated MMXD complex subunit MIP18 [Cyanistes caeruleus]